MSVTGWGELPNEAVEKVCSCPGCAVNPMEYQGSSAYRVCEYYRPIPELAEKAHPDVGLETMALAAHEDQPPAGLGRQPEDSDPAWRQQQELLAHGTHAGDAASVEQ